jgi:hypothetical protein
VNVVGSEEYDASVVPNLHVAISSVLTASIVEVVVRMPEGDEEVIFGAELFTSPAWVAVASVEEELDSVATTENAPGDWPMATTVPLMWVPVKEAAEKLMLLGESCTFDVANERLPSKGTSFCME